MTGTLWSEEEHAAFLRGLKVFGKGKWKDISRHFVVTRTPTQVASHAQKYFIRIERKTRGRRRRSVFDHKEEGTDENNPPPVPSPAPAPAPDPAPALDPAPATVLPSPSECVALQNAASFWMLVASHYHQIRFQIPTRTHEIRKPIPLRDASNVMQALLK